VCPGNFEQQCILFGFSHENSNVSRVVFLSEKLKATLRALLAAVKDFNAKIDAMENNIP